LVININSPVSSKLNLLSLKVIERKNIKQTTKTPIIPFFLSIADKGEFPITDRRMTRFMITLEQGIELVWHAFEDMVGGEIYVKKIPSMKVTDIANAISESVPQQEVGIRPGEKLHEQMVGLEDGPFTFEYSDYFKILPSIRQWSSDPLRIKDGKKVDEGFIYSSDSNTEWMTIETLRNWISGNKEKMERGSFK